MNVRLEITDERIAKNTDVIPAILINDGKQLLLLPRTKLSYPVPEVKIPKRVFRQLLLSAKLSSDDSRILNILVDHYKVDVDEDDMSLSSDTSSSEDDEGRLVIVSTENHKLSMYERMFRIIEFTCDNNDEFTITFSAYIILMEIFLYT